MKEYKTVTQSSMKSKGLVEDSHFPILKITSKGIKPVWYWNKNGDKNQWNSIKISELNPYIYGQLIYCKGSKTIPWGKKESFQ